MPKPLLPLLVAPIAVVAATGAYAVDERFQTEDGAVHVETLADGLSNPWAISFLPDGDMLVTERGGDLRVVSREGDISEPIEGVPEVDARGQGGLLDIALDPDFASNRMIYLSYSEAGEGGNGTAVARGALNDDMTALESVEVIFQQLPKVQSTKHFGSRLVFDREGHLFVTLGERSETEFRTQAQDLDSHLGKIVRINIDGSVPDDNPFVNDDDARHEIYAYGVRNVQAAVLHPETGKLWEIEHGPQGGDELNVIEAGANYGWPVVSLGVNYGGSPVGDGLKTKEGMVDSIYAWTPVIAPSGMMFYDGDALPEWKGDLFVGGLRATALVRLEVDGESVTHEERLLEPLGLRIRDVAQGPDGAIYVATDGADGQILRIAPGDGAN